MHATGVAVSGSQGKSERLNLRVTPEELSTVRKAATERSMSVSAFMLDAALREAGDGAAEPTDS